MRDEAAKILLTVPIRELLERTVRHPEIGGVCGELIGLGRFQEAASRAELEMARGAEEASGPTENGTEAKLAWILAQIHLGSVPATALSAAFHETAELPSNRAAVNRAAVVTAILLIEKLLERGSVRLAASTIERSAMLLDATFGEDGTLFEPLNRYFICILREELSRAQSKREPATYIAKLQAAIEDREKRHGAPPPVAGRPAKRAATPLSAKTLFDEADDQQQGPLAGAEVSVLSAELTEREALPVVLPRSESGNHRLGRRAMAVLIATCLIIVCVGSWQLAFKRRGFGEQGLQLSMHCVAPATLDPEFPAAELRAGDMLTQKMATLNASLTQVSNRVKEVASPSGTDSGADATVDPSVDKAALRSKEAEALQAKGNSRDAELVPLGGESHPAPKPLPPIDPRRIPRLEPGEVGTGLQVHNLDTSSDTTTAHDLRVGPDGRVYGPPRAIDPAIGVQGPEGGRALDGSPLRSYEVEQFTPPLLYRTLVSTNVLAAPSHMAESLSHLDAETPIHVVSKVGPWLELVSAQGRRGYIFAQDAQASPK